MRKLLLAALLAFSAAPALADTWAPAACANGLAPGRPACTYSYVNADGSTPTTPIENACSSLAIEFIPATGGAGTVQGCLDGSCADPRTIATLTSTMFPGPYVTGAPFVRINRTAPSAGTAVVMLRCADNLALGEVPLGTRTSGGYAGSATEGGAASTATALAANGSNCSSQAATGVDASGNAEGCFSPTASPAGSNTEVQFNDSAALGADPQFTWNKTTNTLTVGDGTTQGFIEVKCPTPGSMECVTNHVEDTAAATPSAGTRKLQARSDGFYEIDSAGANSRLYSTRSGSATSAELAGTLTNETGTGVAVFGTTPSLGSAQITDYMEGTEAAAPATPAAGKVRLYAKTGTPGEFCSKDDAGTETCMSAGGGGGAPSTADYLVGTADAGLSAEIVVGTAPGGELGGTWASPTIDDAITLDDATLTDVDALTARLRLGTVTDAPSASQNDYSPTGWDGTHPSKATVIRVSPTVTMQITGIVGGAEGRVLTLVNGTDPAAAGARLIILPHESASSTAGNRFWFPSRQAWFLFPGESVEFLYDNTNTRWRPVTRTSYAELFTLVYSELISNGVDAGSTQSSGTGASCQAGTYLLTSATQNPFGELECDTGSQATGRAGLSLTGTTTGINPEEGSALLLARLAVEALATAGTEDYEVLTGFSDGVATQPLNSTDGVYWLYDVDASTAWRGCAEDAGTQNCATTGPTVDTNFVWLGIFINGDWSRVDYFYSTDGVAWTIGTAETTDLNIPDSADSVTHVPFVIVKEAGTTQRDANLDLVGVRYDAIRGS